jgi:hypothetical protein
MLGSVYQIDMIYFKAERRKAMSDAQTEDLDKTIKWGAFVYYLVIFGYLLVSLCIKHQKPKTQGLYRAVPFFLCV